jgi:hypothetical protein
LFSPDRPRLALVHCGLRQIDEQGQQIDGAKIIVARKRGNVFKDILEAFYGIAPSTIVARRESIMSVGGFDETLVQAEDRDLCLKIAKTWEIDHVPDPLIGLRIHGGSSYGQAKKHNPELVLFERLRVWDRWFDQIDNMEAVLARFRQEAVSTSVSMMLRPTPDFSLYRQLANSDLRLAAHLFPSRPVYLRALFRYSWPGRYLRVLKHKLYEKYKLAIAIVARFKHISASMIPIRSRRRKRMNADDQ